MKLESSIVYGPVRSRRFGWDLGINLLPVKRKVCCYDCVYCQYGFTPISRPDRELLFPSGTDVLIAWNREIVSCRQRGIEIVHTTISGNGEPTMHPDFPNVVRSLVRWRQTYYPQIKIALFSAGHRMMEPEIGQTLQLVDEPILKLDAGNEETWRRLNRPLENLSFHDMKRCFKNVPRLIIQSMFVKNWNDSKQEVDGWLSAIKEIRPSSVQIYTIARKPAIVTLQPVDREFLLTLANRATNLLNLPVTAY